MHKNIEFNSFDNMEKGPIRRSLFRNGACLLFHEAKGFSGAKVSLNFLAGSMFESEEQEGLSHFIEHLVFKEISTNLVRDLELLGAEINAYTYKENVCFEMSCLSSKLEVLLPKFLKLFTKLEFSDEHFVKEKKIIVQEIKEDLDDHETQGLEFLFNKNFSRDLGHPIGGKITQIKKFKREQVESFYKKYYKPERMILTVISGRGHYKKIENLCKGFIQGHYGDRFKRPYRIKALSKAKRVNHTKATKLKKMESAIQFFSFNGPSIGSDNYYDYIVLDELLFEGLSSMFFKKFREENAFVYGLGSSINSFANAGNYIMVFNSQNEHLPSVKKGFKEVFDYILSNGFDESEIDLIKQRILDSWEVAFDSLDERGEFISENEIYGQHHINVKEIEKRVNRVSNKSLKKLVESIYSKNNYTQLSYLKK